MANSQVSAFHVLSGVCARSIHFADVPDFRRCCRSRNAQAGQPTDFAGYATTLALSQAVQGWSEIHRYSLAVLAHAAIWSTGGVEACLRLRRAIVFVLSSRRAADATDDNNLPEAFRIEGVNTNKDGEDMSSFCDISEKIRRGVDGGFRGALASSAAPAGCVPVLYLVKGTVTPAVSRYAVFRPSHHPDDGVLDEDTVAFFHDICRIFMNFVNHGNVIQPLTDCRSGTPLSGVTVRVGKGWMWQQDVGEGAWEEMDRLMPEQAIPFHTTGSATDLRKCFKQW